MTTTILRRCTVVATMALAVATVVAGCGTSTRAVGPSMTSPERPQRSDASDSAGTATQVLARAAVQPIRSGRIDVDAGPFAMSTSFDGENTAVRTRASAGSAPGADAAAAVEMLVVDGRVYVHVGDSYVRVPFGGTAVTGSIGTTVSDTVAAVRGVLRDATVDQPGTPMTVDGVALTRYRAEMTGTKAAGLLDGPGNWSSRIPADQRGGHLLDDVLEHTHVTLLGDVDADGVLRRLEVDATVDPTGSPDCGLLRLLPARTTIVLSDIDRPQSITAPPADRVEDITAVDPSVLLRGAVDGFGAMGGAGTPSSPPTTPTSVCPG